MNPVVSLQAALQKILALLKLFGFVSCGYTCLYNLNVSSWRSTTG